MRKLDNRIATLIRIDEELYEDIKCLAERDNRSINKQIEFILKLYVEKELDVSKLEPGTYSLQVYTKTKDAEDYGEIVDIFASVPTKEATINGKKYRISLNKDRQNRIELIVK